MRYQALSAGEMDGRAAVGRHFFGGGGGEGSHRARFCRIFAPVGILKMPSATLLRENRGRRRPFYISTGRTSGNVQPPLHGVIEFIAGGTII